MGRFFLAGVDAGGPRAHYGATLGPGRAPWRVLWAFKVARAGSFSRGLLSSGGWVKIKLKLPHFHVSNTCVPTRVSHTRIHVASTICSLEGTDEYATK